MSSIVEIRLAAHQSDGDQAHQLSLLLLGNGKVAYRYLRAQQQWYALADPCQWLVRCEGFR